MDNLYNTITDLAQKGLSVNEISKRVGRNPYAPIDSTNIRSTGMAFAVSHDPGAKTNIHLFELVWKARLNAEYARIIKNKGIMEAQKYVSAQQTKNDKAIKAAWDAFNNGFLYDFERCTVLGPVQSLER